MMNGISEMEKYSECETGYLKMKSGWYVLIYMQEN